MKDNIKVELYLPTIDFSKKEYKLINVTTIFNNENNTFIFKYVLPKYICDYLELSGEIINTKTISTSILKDLCEQILKFGEKCIEIKDREKHQSEKYIAVRFIESNIQQKDQFNFASMGFKTSSSFQYFIVYKDIKHPHSLDRYNYKSEVRIGGENFKNGNRKWNYFGINVIEQGGFKLIKWSQEREDYLKGVQEKFIDVNIKLNKFLGDLDEEKLSSLMLNKNILQIG